MSKETEKPEEKKALFLQPPRKKRMRSTHRVVH